MAVIVFLRPQLNGICMRLYEDNKVAEVLAQNSLNSLRSKHTDVRFYCIARYRT